MWILQIVTLKLKQVETKLDKKILESKHITISLGIKYKITRTEVNCISFGFCDRFSRNPNYH